MAKLFRLEDVLGHTGNSRTAHYEDIARGLMTRGIKIGARAVAWPEHEVQAIVNARIAGLTPMQIKALVKRLHEQRSELVEA